MQQSMYFPATTADPESRKGKVRCARCGEWIANNLADRNAHARQENLGMRFMSGRRASSEIIATSRQEV